MLTQIKNVVRSPHPVQRIRDFLVARALFALPVAIRKRIFAGDQRFCSICGNHVRTFLALHRPYHAWCPICRSLQRHRFVWLFLQQRTSLLHPEPKRMLHIAPEAALTDQFTSLPHIEYVSADLYDPNVAIKLDLCAIPAPDNTFDVIYCSHVLEHIPDDRQAMRELRRVLTTTGWAVILVPILNATTFEDFSITDPAEREKVFGQHDHVRRYGADFIERLTDAGFRVTATSVEDLVAPGEIQRLGLTSRETIFFCTRTAA